MIIVLVIQRRDNIMQIQTVQNNTKFSGVIQDSNKIRFTINNALKSNNEISTQFFNTLNYITKDGTKRVLKIGSGFISCGELLSKVSYGKKEVTGSSTTWVNDIIRIGKETYCEFNIKKQQIILK